MPAQKNKYDELTKSERIRIVVTGNKTGNDFTASAKAVFWTLATNGAATRPEIGKTLGLSRPTMSAATQELEQAAFIEPAGEVQGALGRRATRYRVGRGAGHVVAIDAGSTMIRLRASTLDRRLLWSHVVDLGAGHPFLNEEISTAVRAAFDACTAHTDDGWGPLRGLGIALPSRVAIIEDEADVTGQSLVFSRFDPPDGLPVVLENNVNCAAVAEHFLGAGRDHETLAYMQFGFKIGMGLILNGTLLRGRNGAAGEIGHLVFPLSPEAAPRPGEIERYLGADALMARVVDAWPAGAGAAPKDSAELFRRAESGDTAAAAFVEDYAIAVGQVIASVISVVDPGLVILGGGLGTAPNLRPTAAEVATRLSYPVELRSSELGPDATVLGIEKLIIDATIPLILGD